MTENLTQTSATRASSVLRAIVGLGIAGSCVAALGLSAIFLYLDPQIPKPETYRNVQLETPLRIYARDGELIAEYGERRSVPITLDDVPQQFIDALLDTEDKRFYEHRGIDFISLANDTLALVATFVTDGGVGAGASTITMQLARNVSFSLERRFLRKFKEMLLALKIERELTKDQILELYINLVPFGKRAYGAEAAALTYYGKRLKELNLAQLSMLAGIPQAPSAANPINGPTRAIVRRNLVLSRMRAQGSINDAQYQAAIEQPITAKVYARELDAPSPYAAEWVRQQAAVLYPDLYTAGYQIQTTIDANYQREAIAALRRGLLSYDRRHGYRGKEDSASDALIQKLEIKATQLLAAEVEEPTAADERATSQAPSIESDNGTEGEARIAQTTTLTEQVSKRLRSIAKYGDLEPAMVVVVAAEFAIAQLASGQQVTLQLADSAWARPYITVDRRGPPPKQMQDIVNVGDVIRVLKVFDNDEDQWVLAQLPEIQGAIVALDPANGAVRALVGGFDFYRNQYNHATQAARQPGSGFKPFVYSAALANGVTPADIFLDAPLVFDDVNLESQYRPDNDNNRYNGPTRLREALYRSINLVSLRVLLEVGAGNVLNHAAKFGFDTSNFPRNTQLAIGGGTMATTPLDMARAYTVLANGGYQVNSHIIQRITDINGNVLFDAKHPQVCADCDALPATSITTLPETEPASLQALLADQPVMQDRPESLDPEIATTSLQPNLIDVPAAPLVIDQRNVFIMNTMLRDVIQKGTGRAARRLKRSDLAGKTGTTDDAADTWFNGYHPTLVTTVWVGFSNHAPLGARAYGSNTPLPIWIDFMEDALRGAAEETPIQPPGVVTLKIDPETGAQVRTGQPDAVFEYFLQEHSPKPPQDAAPSRDNPDERIKAIDLFGG